MSRSLSSDYTLYLEDLYWRSGHDVCQQPQNSPIHTELLTNEVITNFIFTLRSEKKTLFSLIFTDLLISKICFPYQDTAL